ncbi:MAG: NAD(P)H-dependent oxidoreductase [Myxococcales bacterium]|nr:NAD(P)H-dependent oxidoreductase [Myxococcales bacterium]MBK7194137.1 NAD(P)H-dependent oxidoreductase [Myxococcales bacterium]MBP6849001.1 NAD(P)H-dependent oxidoreductase [Kofleriaceae bacterium]
MQLLGLAGSIRKGSHNRALLRAVGEHLPAGVTLTIFERLAELPTFDPDVHPDPEPVAAWKAALAAADGLVIATPEYNYSVPGVLKNAIDWASRPPPTSPLRGKPVGMVSAAAGMSGGMRAQYHLRQILVYTDSPALMQPEVFVARPQDRFVDGVLTDAATKEHLTRFGAALVAWIERFRPR